VPVLLQGAKGLLNLKAFLACQAKTLMLWYFLRFAGGLTKSKKCELIAARVSTGG
jgi:hypothetical protein